METITMPESSIEAVSHCLAPYLTLQEIGICARINTFYNKLALNTINVKFGACKGSHSWSYWSRVFAREAYHAQERNILKTRPVHGWRSLYQPERGIRMIMI